MSSLLFKESPILGVLPIITAGVAYHNEYNRVGHVAIVVLACLWLFYRYNPHEKRYTDDVIISPCEGTILLIEDRYDYYYIPIFLSVFNKHTQIYPVNGTVVDRKYDHTGQFEIVMYLDKSADNEKKIHHIVMKNGAAISVTQLAGLLPRMITSSDKVPMDVKAGEYLGMIKFGSRVDLLLPKKAPNGMRLILQSNVQKDTSINIGDMIGRYQ